MHTYIQDIPVLAKDLGELICEGLDNVYARFNEIMESVYASRGGIIPKREFDWQMDYVVQHATLRYLFVVLRLMVAAFVDRNEGHLITANQMRMTHCLTILVSRLQVHSVCHCFCRAYLLFSFI